MMKKIKKTLMNLNNKMMINQTMNNKINNTNLNKNYDCILNLL